MMCDFREAVVWYFQALHRTGTPAAEEYRQKFQTAARRVAESLPKYDQHYGLFRTGEFHRGLKLMNEGKATMENFRTGKTLW